MNNAMKKIAKIIIPAAVVLLLIVGIKGNSAASVNNLAGSSQADAASTSTSDGQGVDYYFTKAGEHPETQLTGIINSSKNTLDVAIYSLTDKNIVNAIVNAKNRGVAVRLITDKECSGKNTSKQSWRFWSRQEFRLKSTPTAD